jgi:phosphoribosylformylglycinamidine synthase
VVNNVLIVGSGAREHALGWKLKQSSKVGKIYFAPGSAGTEQIGTSTNISMFDHDALIKFAIEKNIDLTVAGPDDALAAGIVNAFQKKGLRIFGATKEATQIESSKAFAKELMKEEKIPTAKYEIFTDFTKAKKYIEKQSLPIVIKASGLALGKGVIIAKTLDEAIIALEEIMVKKVFGKAGDEVVIEEFLIGTEISIHAFSDGENVELFPASRDHKTIFEGNTGPNTGGMGTIAPAPEITDKQLEEIKKTIVLPAIHGMKKRNMPFSGCLYPGLMITKNGPKVVEFNSRFGDPEMETYMRLLETDLFDILMACTEKKLNKIKIKWSKKFACCIVLASSGYPETSHKGDVIYGLEKIKNKDVVVFYFAIKKEHGKILTNGGRILGVTATGKNLDEALNKAYSSIGENGIHFDGMQLRRDIGGVKPSDTKASRIEVFSKVFDTRADVRKKKFLQINKNINNVEIADVFTIDKELSADNFQKISSALSNPVTEITNIKPQGKFSFVIEIGYLPGVTDNIANTAKETIIDLLKTEFADQENVYTSQITFINGNITKAEAIEIAETLYNPLIQRMNIKSYDEYIKNNGMDITVPKVKLQHKPQVTEVDLNVSDEELIKIGKSGIANSDETRRGPLALDLLFMKTIQKHFKDLGRNPTDIELESIAQTWSEHCKHTIFANPIDEIKEGLYKTYIKGATEEIRKKKGKNDFCVSVFTDNSGGIVFDDEYLVTHKVETHNSPSALDPFGGAITGIVGVNRDTLGFGLGAKPIANFYGFCLADPRIDVPLYKGKNKNHKMLSSRRIMNGVIEGVNAGGNQSGIPTPQGFIYFDERFRGKPLVFVGTVGLIPRKMKGKLSHIKKANPGDLIAMIGGRVGKDGIHGATFSSESLSGGSPATAVQIGDPITQKKLSDAITNEARDLLLYNSITDNGAGGLSCSVAEMAKESGGCEVTLEKVPLKYSGLDPWEIWISESQERMTLAIPEKNIKQFEGLMNRRGVEVTVIGKFTKSGKCVVKYNSKKIMDLDMEFLHNGLPKEEMITKYSKNEHKDPKISSNKNLTQSLMEMLKRLNIASFEFISQQYDHIVKANFVLGPLQGRGRINAETSVIRPLLNSDKGVILSQGLYPLYSDIDTYHMAAASLDTAVRNAIAAGANPDYISLLDNFCWTSADEPERLGQLKQAVKACYDFAIAYEAPFISGKDSMFNDFNGFDKNNKSIKISIPPTLLISSFGVIDDITKVVSLDAKNAGDIVYILGETFEELGGSEYFAMNNAIGNSVPKVNAEKNKKLYKALYNAIQKDLVASSISITKGGLGVALSKTAIGGMLGINVDLKNVPGNAKRDDFILYSESQGRILVTVAKENKSTFEKIMNGNSFSEIGEVTKEDFVRVKGLDGEEIINFKLETAAIAYRETFKDY